MGALDDAAAFAVDPELLPPLTVALCTAAVAISNEDAGTAGHGQRAELARAILHAPTSMAATLAWTVATNTTVVGKWTSDDHDGALGDLAYVLGSVWNGLAGVPSS